MKKNILALLVILSTQEITYSSEELSMDKKILSSVNSNPGIVAYMKDVLSTPSGNDILNEIISPNQHHDINFNKVIKEKFKDDYWFPKKYDFKDKNLNEILFDYYNKDKIDDYHVFISNLLYHAGNKFYKQEKNPEFLEYSASIGHDKAQYEMFLIELKSRHFPQATNYLLSSASQGNHEALLKLSDIYQGGYKKLIQYFPERFKKPNQDIARKFCEISADLGNDEANFIISVSTWTEGFFGYKIDYQKGIMNAKELADKKNKRAEDFINSIINSSEESLLEGNESITRDDLIFLGNYLNWKR